PAFQRYLLPGAKRAERRAGHTAAKRGVHSLCRSPASGCAAYRENALTERATMSKSDVYNAVMGKIAKRLGREPRIVYELGGNPASGKVVDNLDEIAFLSGLGLTQMKLKPGKKKSNAAT